MKKRIGSTIGRCLFITVLFIGLTDLAAAGMKGKPKEEQIKVA